MTQISSAVMGVYFRELLLVEDISSVVGLTGENFVCPATRKQMWIELSICCSTISMAQDMRNLFLLVLVALSRKRSKRLIQGYFFCTDVMYFWRKETVWSVFFGPNSSPKMNV